MFEELASANMIQVEFSILRIASRKIPWMHADELDVVTDKSKAKGMGSSMGSQMLNKGVVRGVKDALVSEALKSLRSSISS